MNPIPDKAEGVADAAPAFDYKLTESVFLEAERHHADLMEPWSSRLGDIDDNAERQRIMRAGLAATFRQRFPMAEDRWPKADQVASPDRADDRRASEERR